MQFVVCGSRTEFEDWRRSQGLGPNDVRCLAYAEDAMCLRGHLLGEADKVVYLPGADTQSPRDRETIDRELHFARGRTP